MKARVGQAGWHIPDGLPT